MVNNCGCQGMKGSTYTKKMRPAGSILVEIAAFEKLPKNPILQH